MLSMIAFFDDEIGGGDYWEVKGKAAISFGEVKRRSRMSLSLKQSKIKTCIEKEESNNAANHAI
jgi:hypothetical protein